MPQYDWDVLDELRRISRTLESIQDSLKKIAPERAGKDGEK